MLTDFRPYDVCSSFGNGWTQAGVRCYASACLHLRHTLRGFQESWHPYRLPSDR